MNQASMGMEGGESSRLDIIQYIRVISPSQLSPHFQLKYPQISNRDNSVACVVVQWPVSWFSDQPHHMPLNHDTIGKLYIKHTTIPTV